MAKKIIYASGSAVLDQDRPDENLHSDQTVQINYKKQLLLQFPFPTDIQYKKINSVTAYVYVAGFRDPYGTGVTHYDTVNISGLQKPFDENVVTWNKRPAARSVFTPSSTSVQETEVPKYVFGSTRDYFPWLKEIITAGIIVHGGAGYLVVATSRYATKAYLEIEYEPETSAPTVGGVSKPYFASAADQEFEWTQSMPDTLTTMQANRTLFQWRVKGNSSYNTVVSTGTYPTNRKTKIPANTFPIGTIEWRYVVETDAGSAGYSPWYESIVQPPKATNLSPGAGAYTPKRLPAVFTWDINQFNGSGKTPITMEQARATVYWRVTGTTTTKSIAISGGEQKVTIPANTFTADSIDWKVTAITTTGATADSDWVTVSTIEELSTAVPLSPKGVIVDSTVVNRFVWAHIISTGTAQTKAELQRSTDHATWSALGTVTGSDTFFDVPKGTFTAKTNFWRVRTYNSDGKPGAWSDSAEFIAVVAPETPGVTATRLSPRPSISWQTTEQQAYQIELDGELIGGTQYGSTKQWRSPKYLSDGMHVVRVRVQSEYGLWSDWGSAALPITNVPGENIQLHANVDNEASLVWSTSGKYDFYIVERDGVAIAKTEELLFVDSLAKGTVRYRIRGGFAENDNYGLSNEEEHTVHPKYNVLYDLETGEWLTLKHSGLLSQPFARNLSRAISEIQLSGAVYPIVERGIAKTTTYDGNVVFFDQNESAKFEGMVGDLVCLKTVALGGCIGYLNEVSGTVNQYKQSYSFMIVQIDHEEEIDIDS